MKFLILLALGLPVASHAVSFGKIRSDVEGSSSQVFAIEEGKATFEKTSNLFDVTPKDYRVGRFEVTSDKLKETYAGLVAFEKKLKVVDEALQKKKSSFNQMSGAPGHKTVIMVGNFRIMPESQYYQELEEKFNELKKLEWTLNSGYKISPDLKEVSVYKDGKIEKTEKYQVESYCKENREVCTYSSGGKIFVK